MMSKTRLITLVVAAFVILCPVLTQAADAILTEDFEDNALDSRIHVETIGDVTNPSPGLKDITEFGSQKAFGFGRSTCGADCWDGFVTKFIIQFPSPTFVSYLSFKEMELFGNWGSEGYIIVDGTSTPEYCGQYTQDFGRCPVNDWQTDVTFRTKSFLINKVVETIELRSWDITNVSEIFIDDLKVFGAFGQPVSIICQVAHNGDYDPDPGSLKNLVTEIINRTGKNEVFNGGFVTLDSVPSCSMLYITGHYPFSFTETERTNLRTYLQDGGFVFADDCANYLDDSGFESSFRTEIQNILGYGLAVLPTDHSVFSSFYSLSETLPTVWNNEPLEGINIGDRTSVIYSDNDYGCAWGGQEGECDLVCKENSFEMGVNIATFAMHSSSYDSDNDGLPDSWEISHFGDLIQNPGDDYDHDELTNLQEYQLGTDPIKWDTDGDGVNDGTEVANGTNPLIPDVTLEPNISVDPLSSYFGEFDAGEGCLAEQAITISNTGNIDLSISDIALSYTNDFKLSITALSCEKSIKAGESCTFTVSFCPSSESIRTATLSITSNDTDTPKVDVQLIGRGLIPADYITNFFRAITCNENNAGEGKIPLILIHGIHGTGDSNNNKKLDNLEEMDAVAYWSAFAQNFCSDAELRNKYKIYLFSYLSDIYSVWEIARSLRNHIDHYIQQRRIEDTQFVILAHSMGGLVARSYIQQHSHAFGRYQDKRGGERVINLITLATPHHGSPAACEMSRNKLADDADHSRDWTYLPFWNYMNRRPYYNGWKATTEVASLVYWWWLREDKTNYISYTEPNRKDLLWDNFDGIMGNNKDLNGWLKKLNKDNTYDDKLTVYYGHIDTKSNEYKNIVKHIYVRSSSGGPGLLLDYARANKDDQHKELLYSSILMAYGLYKDYDNPYAKNDGMVPFQSGRFSGHKVAKRVNCPNHDHLDMMFEVNGDKNCSNGKTLFDNVADDLLNIR